METLYFLGMVLAVGWLMAWVALPDDSERRLWWPFDMKEPEGPAATPGQGADGALPRPSGGWRDRAAKRLSDGVGAPQSVRRRAPSQRRRGPD
jgi:hypothetical protein